MNGEVDVAMSRRDERDDADVVCVYFLQFWPNMMVKQLGQTFRYDENKGKLPDYDVTIFKDCDEYSEYLKTGILTSNTVTVDIDFDAVSLTFGENWDIGSVVAHYYKYGEQSSLLA